jgi:single-stranded DNA-specific DHH superfamily exonuclease
MVAEGGGHPMAAGAFVLPEYLEEFLDLVSSLILKMLKSEGEEKVG